VSNRRRRHFGTKVKGKNGAASNDGILIKWEKVVGWGRRRKRSVDTVCCEEVSVSSVAKASEVQWDRLGVYSANGEIYNDWFTKCQTPPTQKLYYMIGQFDGWLLGPTLGVNYGGIKNTHDGMCVHGSHERIAWGYYDGPTNIDNPEDAYPYWKFDDDTLMVSCIKKTVSIVTEMVPDDTRGPALVQVFRRVRPLLSARCGPLPQEIDKINVDLWIVKARCKGSCGPTSISLKGVTGIVDALIVASYTELNIRRHCIKCYPYWAGRLISEEKLNSRSGWRTVANESQIVLHVIMVGYGDKVEMEVNIDSDNVVHIQAERLMFDN